MLPEPGVVQVPPPVPMHVQVTPVSLAGNTSDTVAPVTPVCDPAGLEATMV